MMPAGTKINNVATWLPSIVTNASPYHAITVNIKMTSPIVYFLIHNNNNAGTSMITALKYTSTPVTPPVNATSDIIKISAILILGSKFSKWLCGIV